MRLKRRTTLSAWQILALGYLIVIFLGAVLLYLPFSTQKGESTSFLNALFTSTSATCVTGLVPYDTNTHWTGFGQTVILCLIQLGGLGFMTFVTLLFHLLGKNMSLQNQKLFMLSSGEEKRSDTNRLFKRLLLGTLIIEGVGAILLSVRFIQDFGFFKGIYYAIFHAVSAFCNAGFDIMGGTFNNGEFVSLTHYVHDPLVCITICALIIIGGLGFCVWDDLLESKGNFKKFRLHTKIVLCSTAALLLISTLLFLLFEIKNPAFSGNTFGQKLLVAFFNATTPRTAGFNTIDFSTISDGSYFFMIILMFIGGSSASTAGGVKITTLFVIIAGMFAVFSGKRDIELGKRRIHNSLLRQALAVFVSCLFMVIVATLIICSIEADNPVATFQAVLFETISAMGTVGLSLSLTPTLSSVSKIVLILLMYAGRVGILTIGLAFGEKKDVAETKKPIDNVLIG